MQKRQISAICYVLTMLRWMQAVFAYGYILAVVYFLLFLVLYWFRGAALNLVSANLQAAEAAQCAVSIHDEGLPVVRGLQDPLGQQVIARQTSLACSGFNCYDHGRPLFRIVGVPVTE
jgi:hypothetical protein